MGIANNKLTSPMSWGDISTATKIGGPPYTMGNMVDSGFPTMNKWSKVLPFEPATSIVAFSSASHRDTLAKAVAYGFTIPTYASANALHSGFSAANEGNVWTRTLKPRTWWRSGPNQDLDGYVLDASGWGLGKYIDPTGALYLNAPFGAYVECKTTLGAGNLFYIGISASSSGASDGLMSLTDFTGLTGMDNFASWYFGVALISKTGTYANDYYYVLNTPISGNISEAVTITSTIANGSYYIVPILASSHTSNAWAGSSSFPTKVVTLDGWYGEIVKQASASGFSWTAGMPYIENGVLKVKVTIANYTGAAVTVNRLFSYTMTDEASMQSAYYQALTEACQYWVNNKEEKTGGAGVKNSSNQVIAVYRQLATSLSVPAMSAGTSQEYTYQLTTGLTDALGYPYNSDSDVRLCMQYNTSNYVCNNIY